MYEFSIQISIEDNPLDFCVSLAKIELYENSTYRNWKF